MRRVLAIGAHPDDVEIGCGGTLAKCAAAGDSVSHLVVTSGEAGSDTIPPKTLARTREAEARRAGKALGAAKVEFLRLRDGLTSYSRADKIALVNRIRALRPDVVFVHARSDAFPDHRVVHELAMAALTAAAGPWYQESRGAPWQVGSVLGYEVWHPLNAYQLAVDITPTLEMKLKALRCHASQMAAIAYDEAAAGLARYRGAMSGAGTHAEVFEVIRQATL